jgi:hypothetical protein
MLRNKITLLLLFGNFHTKKITVIHKKFKQGGKQGVAKKGNMRILVMMKMFSLLTVNVLFMVLYYSFTRCYHLGKTD